MDVLLTFVGSQDPYAAGLIESQEIAGPILSLLSARQFDRIALFSTPGTQQNAMLTEEVLTTKYPRTEVDLKELQLDDPTDYPSILREIRAAWAEVCRDVPNARSFISLASGTPQIHTCWVMLAASGEIPGQLLYVRRPKFVTRDRPLVSVIDPLSPHFPLIRRNLGDPGVVDEPQPDLDSALQELEIATGTPAMREALRQIAAFAGSDMPVLLLGETGTGKERLARLAHRLSDRNQQRFIVVNCPALPEEIVESLLFGHEKGVFTGADRMRKGKFEEANGGTILLDEVGDLALGTQAKLLRFLQEGEVERLGQIEPDKVDVRVIAATNRDLNEVIREGRFREDLYYRLAAGLVEVPPLRERRDDIPIIALQILDSINAKLRPSRQLSCEALVALRRHDWPGNIRELENVLARSVHLCRSQVLTPGDLDIRESPFGQESTKTLPEPHEGFSLPAYCDDVRQRLMKRALEIADGNHSHASRLLGVTPQAVSKFVKRYRVVD